MSDRKRYVVTVPSCNCDAESAYVELTDEEVGLLERVDKALDRWGGAIYVATVDEADEYNIGRAESNARYRAIDPEEP